MGNQQTATEGEKTVITAGNEPPKEGGIQTPPLVLTEGNNPDPKQTQEPEQTGEPTATTTEPPKELTSDQKKLYNETLRAVSLKAHAGLQARYNAFEDVEVKRAVRAAVLAGETPDAAKVAADVITRLTPPAKKDQKPAADPKPQSNDEIQALKAELALVKAGILPERLEAAKKLIDNDPAKVEEFVKQYPEWKAKSGGGVTFAKAPPVEGKTAAGSGNPPVMTDFEKKVYEARKARGLPT